ncbi:putative UAF30-subunit of RNA polymerase I transcription factor [Fusarium austroafricanum]|uniref:Putative UAF30-subunit of RNA polymerase I transcription factor n=1 Tax=Fusarium austroafricanum TaxID=2364996 RepID=A0A8H4KWR2_9HYPO|nr:putative UAF30-subunit of RNA polymerase I transcription factor [Fusarium austroafricanum]
MSVPLTTEELERYTAIIDDILETSDLETISRKKIRQGLENALGGQDLSDQKNAIKRLIEARFDAVSGANNGIEPPSAADSNGATNGVSDVGETEQSATPEPSRKKVKRSSSAEDADAKLAAQLQAQENSLARGRKTRGGDKKPTKKKAAPRKKSAKKVKADDDSDMEPADGETGKKRKAGGGFQKPFNLSETLSELVGETQLSRPQVVKKLWEHIKANDLQDPNDKRQIICDEKMHAVFKQAKVDMFRMNKDIGSHLYPVGEE